MQLYAVVKIIVVYFRSKHRWWSQWGPAADNAANAKKTVLEYQ